MGNFILIRNYYHILGGYRFPVKIIQSDGEALSHKEPYNRPYIHQRGFGVLNGIEREGWPQQQNLEIKDWSGGMNNHFFWEQNARKPTFNYINHKCWEHEILEGKREMGLMIASLVGETDLMKALITAQDEHLKFKEMEAAK